MVPNEVQWPITYFRGAKDNFMVLDVNHPLVIPRVEQGLPDITTWPSTPFDNGERRPRVWIGESKGYALAYHSLCQSQNVKLVILFEYK